MRYLTSKQQKRYRALQNLEVIIHYPEFDCLKLDRLNLLKIDIRAAKLALETENRIKEELMENEL